MARPRLFDEDQVLDAAMRAFWANGYEATSTEQLCAATGMGRGSVYNTFRSKPALFEQALARYMAEKTSALIELLEGVLSIREKVHIILWQAIEPPATDPAGCLVVNSMVELAPHDRRLAKLLQTDYRRRWDALTAAFIASQRRGDTAKRKDAGELAHFVLATLTSLRVMARAGTGRTALVAVATTALAAI